MHDLVEVIDQWHEEEYAKHGLINLRRVNSFERRPGPSNIRHWLGKSWRQLVVESQDPIDQDGSPKPVGDDEPITETKCLAVKKAQQRP